MRFQKLKAKLGLVVSEFNNEITYKMLARAKQYIKRADASIRYVCYVPGSFDMPLMIGELLKKKRCRCRGNSGSSNQRRNRS